MDQPVEKTIIHGYQEIKILETNSSEEFDHQIEESQSAEVCRETSGNKNVLSPEDFVSNCLFWPRTFIINGTEVQQEVCSSLQERCNRISTLVDLVDEGTEKSECLNHQKNLEQSILSGDLEKLHQVIENLSSYEDPSNRSCTLEYHLSKTYEELKIKNVPIKQDLEIFIVYKLVDLRFFTKKDPKLGQDIITSLEDITEKIDRVINLIDKAVKKYSKGNVINDFFVFICTTIAKEVHILKHSLKSSYDKLPWEEIEFCLITYLTTIIKSAKSDDVYKLIMDKHRVLAHLINFACGLEKLKPLLNERNINKNLRLGARSQVIQSVKSFISGFDSLYYDYNLVKDISSLKRIDSYIQVCMNLDFKDTIFLDKLIIERTLQVIGECLKSTPESPNVSDEVNEMIERCAPNKLKVIITSLRNNLSHTEAFVLKTILEESKPISFFKDIQNDLSKIHYEISDILLKRKLGAVAAFIKKVLQCSTIDEVYILSQSVQEFTFDSLTHSTIKVREYEKVELLVDLLNYKFEEQVLLETEKEVFEEIKFIIKSQKKKFDINLYAYQVLLFTLGSCILDMESNNNLEFIHVVSNFALEEIEGILQNDSFQSFRSIVEKFWKLKASINNRRSDVDAKKINSIITEILDLIVLKSGNISDIYRFHSNLEHSSEDDIGNVDKYEDLIELMMRNAENCFDSEKDEQSFKKAFESKKQLHRIKTEVISMINSRIQNRILDSSDLERCQKLVKHLKMQKNESKFLSNFVSGNVTECKSAVNVINDPYGLLLKKMSDFNIFSYQKHCKLLETFLSSLKLNKASLDKIMNNFAEENIKEVKRFYTGRLNLLQKALCQETEDKVKAIKRYLDSNKLQIITELILLDLFNILETSSFFFDNRYFLQEYSPILLGKALRNYLAHGNNLIDILPFNTSLMIVSSALKLIEQGGHLIERKDILIGKKLSTELLKSNTISDKIHFLTIQNLMYAASMANDLTTVSKSIEKGAIIVSRDMAGWNGLHYSASKDSLEVFEFFFDNDLDLNSQDNLGRDPVHIAVANESNKVFQWCFSKKVLSNVSNLLYKAAEYGNKEIFDKLLNECNEKSVLCKAFDIACENGHKDIIDILLTKSFFKLDSLSTKGLHYACMNGHEPIVETLLQYDFNINRLADDGLTPLYLAVKNGHKNIVKILLQNGASIDCCFEEDISNDDSIEVCFSNIKIILASLVTQKKNIIPPLHLACLLGFEAIIKALLDKGACVNQVSYNFLTPLHMAIIYNRVDIVELLIEYGADVNMIPENILSPLHLAVRYGNSKIVECLIKNKAIIEIMGKSNVIPLHLACQYGYKSIVEQLTLQGYDINIKTSKMETSLYLASEMGHADIVEYLLDKGAEVSCFNCDGNTPLHAGSCRGHLRIVELLLNHNANVDAVNLNNFTALHYAARYGYNDIVNVLLEFGAKMQIFHPCQMSALHCAVEGNHLEVIENLLSKNADVNEIDGYGLTPLHLACKNGLNNVVDLLIKNSAQCNIKTNDKVSALDIAVSYGHENIVAILLASGANVEDPTTNGLTPLCLAVKNGDKHLVDTLLKSGACVNAGDDDKISPLHFACERNDKEIVELLLKNGANIKAVDGGNATPLHIAAQRGNIDVVDFLLATGGEDLINSVNCGGETVLHLASESGSSVLVSLLLNNGAAIGLGDEEGYTPLHVASQNGHEDIVEILIEAGISINFRSLSNVTPLHMAAENGSKGVMNVLISRGADVNATESTSSTPLHIAVQYSRNDAVELLLSAGARVNQFTSEGLTELHFAAQNDNLEIVSMLISKGAITDVRSKDGNYSTPLHYACLFGCIKVVSLLLENGADIGSKNADDLTPMHLALAGEHQDVLFILTHFRNGIQSIENSLQQKSLHTAVTKGALDEVEVLLKNLNVNQIDEHGRTPLHIAILNDKYDLVQLLLNSQADVNIPFNGMLPIHLAIKKGNIDIFTLLLHFKAEDNVPDIQGFLPIHIAAREGHSSILEVLLRRGIFIDAITPDGITALHLAARNGDLHTVSLLLEYGADIFAKNYHDTVIHQVVSSRDINCLKLTLEHVETAGEFDYINTRDSEGDTPLMWAIENHFSEAVKLLLEYGSDINIQNNDGWTSLHWCLEVNDLDSSQLLLEQSSIDVHLKNKENKDSYDIFKNKMSSWLETGIDQHKIEALGRMFQTKFGM